MPLGNTGSPSPDDLFNDLAPAALEVAPELADVMSQLAAVAERPAHLTGSGSALFVLCDDPLDAAALAGTVEAKLDLPALAVQSYGVVHARLA